ncbi:MAG: hypothetical protein EOP48_09355 [Sphingobacteriales bacterium]|nr:MAG: hypothetical protein EOP48_09355 [Sphingobacteriales bacterium]
MKKVLIAILAIFYLAVASGVEMNIHYCMGEVASVEYGKAEKGLCGKCGMESKQGCCEDETTLLKIQDSHQSSQLSWVFQLPVAELPQLSMPDPRMVVVNEAMEEHPSNGPPPGSSPPIYLKNCVFRI